MIAKLITLFKLGRKIAKSDILEITSKFQEPPLTVKIFFKILSFSFSSKQQIEINKDIGERLSNSLESMGTTFIKLGQFLATRPDIIGEELSKKLENLQDKLPPFSLLEAKEIIKNDLGDDTYNSIINLSEPVAAASIAQVHKAQINDNGTITCRLPKTQVEVVARLLTGKEENKLTSIVKSDNQISKQLESLIVSVNGDTTREAINYVANNIPSMDSRHLRLAIKKATPNVDLTQEFSCEECGHTQEMEVPLTADFFWPE